MMVIVDLLMYGVTDVTVWGKIAVVLLSMNADHGVFNVLLLVVNIQVHICRRVYAVIDVREKEACR